MSYIPKPPIRDVGVRGRCYYCNSVVTNDDYQSGRYGTYKPVGKVPDGFYNMSSYWVCIGCVRDKKLEKFRLR